MHSIVAILSRIKTGERRFTPEDDSPTALQAFQALVQVLVEAERQQLISGLKVGPVSKGRDTYGLVLFAHVAGGLTYRGEEYLSAPPKQASEVRAWLMAHLAQIVVGVIGGVVAAIVIKEYGLQ